jgi:hypothetical protein
MPQQQDFPGSPNAVTRVAIVSGGQTGVDRGALDAALAAGGPCGGWCPAGRRAEDGAIPARYPLTEMPSADYLARTRKNVDDSDATLVITYGAPSGGTRRTVEFCQRLKKPYLIVDAAAISIDEAIGKALEFVQGRGMHRLNVAGPRASGEPRGYDAAFQVVAGLLARHGGR